MYPEFWFSSHFETPAMLTVEELGWLTRRRRKLPYRRRMYLFRLVMYAIERPLVPEGRFCLAELSNADCTLKFRFDSSGLMELCALLGVPNVVVTATGDRCLGIDALCVLLNRMAYPRRYYDMMESFGRSRESMCRIFGYLVDLLYDQWHGHLFFCLSIVKDRLQSYGDAISAKGAILDNIFGFIDGSKLETCRITQKRSRVAPGNHGLCDLQRYIYSGHKRRHCLNFQAVTAPDGLCIHFWGPIEGSRHDTTLLWESKLMEFMDIHADIFGSYLIYGDPAYGILPWVCSGYKGQLDDPRKQEFNKSMSRVRQSVEWSFCQMKTQWAFVTYKMQQKIMLQSVGKTICLAMFLTNCQTCYYGGNQTSVYFNLKPPALKEYLTK
jgi:hypothetical protein